MWAWASPKFLLSSTARTRGSRATSPRSRSRVPSVDMSSTTTSSQLRPSPSRVSASRLWSSGSVSSSLWQGTATEISARTPFVPVGIGLVCPTPGAVEGVDGDRASREARERA